MARLCSPDKRPLQEHGRNKTKRESENSPLEGRGATVALVCPQGTLTREKEAELLQNRMITLGRAHVSKYPLNLDQFIVVCM